MITEWQSGETIVGRLRVAGARVDPAMAQLRLSMLLNNAISQPASLPASAIVFIRKLVDPLPRSLRLQRYELRPPAAWQQALNARLESLIAHAARPALGAVPANAEAVVFLDRSELLAAFASDWCTGQVATRWWWQNILRGGSAYGILKDLWQNAPEYVPAALDRLAKSEMAATFVKTFTAGETRALLNSVVRAFQLEELARVFNEPPSQQDFYFQIEEVSPTLPPSSIRPRPRATIRPKTEVLRSAPWIRGVRESETPWARWVRESETRGLAPEQQELLSVALMLQRAPTQLRTKNFAREVEAWHRELIVAQHIHFDPIVQNDQIQNEQPTPSSPLPHSTPASSSSNPRKSVVHSLPRIVTDVIASETLELITDHSDEPVPASQKLTTLPQPAEREWTNSETPTIIPTDAPAVAPEHLPLLEFQINTEFGGVFYLINLGINLGFYGDFTTPLEPGINLNVWDFVALLGRELAGEGIQSDPVWTLLERLSGREEGEHPGTPEDKVWLQQQMPYIRTRLRTALGLSETEDPGSIVCNHHARVCITPAHVDVVFALAHLPIEIRMSGLDRDPGWLPAAGRFINFYFE